MNLENLYTWLETEFDKQLNENSRDRYEKVLRNLDSSSFQWICKQIEVRSDKYRSMPKPIEIKRLYREWQNKDGDILTPEKHGDCDWCHGTGLIPIIRQKTGEWYLCYVPCDCLREKTSHKTYGDIFPNGGQNSLLTTWDKDIYNYYCDYIEAVFYDIYKPKNKPFIMVETPKIEIEDDLPF